MSDIVVALLLHFISLTGPNGQTIDIAVDQIVSLRDRRAEDDKHFHPEVKCLVFTVDGKFIAVRETCKEVETRLNEIYHKREEGN